VAEIEVVVTGQDTTQSHDLFTLLLDFVHPILHQDAAASQLDRSGIHTKPNPVCAFSVSSTCSVSTSYSSHILGTIIPTLRQGPGGSEPHGSFKTGVVLMLQIKLHASLNIKHPMVISRSARAQTMIRTQARGLALRHRLPVHHRRAHHRTVRGSSSSSSGCKTLLAHYACREFDAHIDMNEQEYTVDSKQNAHYAVITAVRTTDEDKEERGVDELCRVPQILCIRQRQAESSQGRLTVDNVKTVKTLGRLVRYKGHVLRYNVQG
jgi:hypothetical protein